jgi:diguanylate cyclase (GGDEF)-like protein/PAS domain S-box-containing protein
MKPSVKASNGRRPPSSTAERYQLLFDRNPQPMWVYDRESLAFLAVNDAAIEHYGYSREEFMGMTCDGLAPADDSPASDPESPQPTPIAEPSNLAPGTELTRCRHHKKNGSLIDVELLSDELPFEGRGANLVVALDITERRRTHSELRRRTAQHAAVARLGANALEGMEVGQLCDEAAALVAEALDVELTEVLERDKDQESLILRAGVGWRRGVVRSAPVPIGSRYYAGFTWGSLGHTVVRNFAKESRFQPTTLLQDHGVVSGASVIIGRRGHPFGLLGAFSRTERDFEIEDIDFLKAVANVIANAIERKRSEDEIRHQALHDPLTALPNRTLLLERLTHWLEQSQRSGGRGAVLFVDLDHFKMVNDGLGHDCGDQLLLGVAARLKNAVRATDTVARVGGDEFVVFCEDSASDSAALELVERIGETLENPFTLDGSQRHMTASIGIAFASAGDNPESLVRDADAAMYRAKERGRARFELFDEAMRERSLHWLQIERDLRQAIQRGDLYNLYQPVVSTDGETIGFEALVRWRHPVRGTISPADFISVADESGLIIPLGRQVLHEACREAARWPATDRPLSVSVNLSPRQVAHPSLVGTVAQALDLSGLDPHRLNLEITETVLIEDSDSALEALRNLKALGVGLMLDDFGTGYSSLGYVKRFPIDALKIDRSFVDGLGHDAEDDAIVTAVLSMGRALGLEVVAEGVETREQARHLQSLGCTLAQGFLFARPLTPEAVIEHIRQSPPPGARTLRPEREASGQA